MSILKRFRALHAVAVGIVVVGALCILTGIPPLKPIEERAADSPREDYAREYCAKNPQNPVCPGLIAFGERVKASREEAEAEKREKRRAEWREFWIAAGTVFLTLGTVALAVFTLRLWQTTRRAVRIASADAKRVLRQSQIHSERELRAHVFIDKAQVIFTQSDGRITAHVDLLSKNFGRTPAYKVSTVTSAKLVDWPLTDALVVDPYEGGVDVVGPNSERSHRLAEDDIDPDDLVAMKSGSVEAPSRKAFFVFGHIKYTDAFGKPRNTSFRLYMGGDNAPVRELRRLATGGVQESYGLGSHNGGNDAD